MGDYEVLTAPDDPPPRHAPPPAPDARVDAALCADMHGTVACALWVIAPEAIALPGASGLSLAALSNAPTKGVTRRRAGSPLPMATPASLVRHRGTVWAGVAAAGEGDAARARDRYLRARLALAGVAVDGALAPDDPAAIAAFRGLVLWVAHEGDEVRGTSEALA